MNHCVTDFTSTSIAYTFNYTAKADCRKRTAGTGEAPHHCVLLTGYDSGK